jgi:hypothetical protein
LNKYGFVILKTGDTILAHVKYEFAYNKPKLSDENELRLKYPKHLKKYAYKEKISLSEIQKFYFGSPPIYQVVKKYRNQFINLEVVSLGRYNVYKRHTSAKVKNYAQPLDSSFPMRLGSSSTIIEILYIQKDDGPLVKIYDEEHDLQTLETIFTSDLSKEEIKKLIKGRNIENINNKIIEVIKKLNQK